MAEQVAKFLTDIVSSEYRWKIKLFENWDNIVGKLKNQTRIEKVENNLLVIGVIHPALAQELLLLSNILKKKIETLLGRKYITEIRFKTVTFGIKKQNNPNKKIENSKIVFENKFLNKTEHETLSNIKNEELKKILKEFCFRCKGERDVFK